MNSLNLLPVFIVGLLGSVHCVGMCGGIVSAFSAAPALRRPFPVAISVDGTMQSAIPVADIAARSLSYNAGRIGSYMAAGALAGGLLGSAQAFAKISSFQLVGFAFANLMLIALGLYLMDAWRGLSRLESAGQALWKHIRPLTGKLLPVDSLPKLMMFGALWGWLPCGMVYSVLLTAMLTGSAWSGASVMLAFGLGTLPMLLALGVLGVNMQARLQQRSVRIASGLIVLGFGVLGLVRLAYGMPLGWLELLCLTPAASGGH